MLTVAPAVTRVILCRWGHIFCLTSESTTVIKCSFGCNNSNKHFMRPLMLHLIQCQWNGSRLYIWWRQKWVLLLISGEVLILTNNELTLLSSTTIKFQNSTLIYSLIVYPQPLNLFWLRDEELINWIFSQSPLWFYNNAHIKIISSDCTLAELLELCQFCYCFKYDLFLLFVLF